MTAIIRPATVRKSITVNAAQQRAFDVFTRDFGNWWPHTHSIGASRIVSATIEPKVGGRWYEMGEDGTECDWGEVLAWEPPARIVLAWRIGPDWKYNKSLLTEVELTFTPVDDNSTRVELEHRLIENMGDAAEMARSVYNSEGGWTGLLALYAQRVNVVQAL